MRIAKVAMSALGAMSVGSACVAAPAVSFEQLSLKELGALICQQKVSSQAVVAFWLDRIERANPGNNAFISFDREQSLRLARQEDRRIRSGEACRPLGGVPIAVKDNIQVVGFANTAGTPALSDYRPRRDAPVVSTLREAGAIVIGKTNMHELAFGATGYNLAYQAGDVVGVRNAYDPARIAGGSSSGSAVAIAANLAPVALGTDTGGSTRIPCAFNHCVGFRPTVGRYSGEGVVPISRTRDTIGPMGRSVEDIVFMDSIITGQPAQPSPAPSAIRLGVPDVFWQDLDAEVEAVARQALDRLRRAGVQLVPVQMPDVWALSGIASTAVAIYEAKRDLSEYLAKQDTGLSLQALADGIASPDVRGIFQGFVVPGRLPGADGTASPSLQAAYEQALRVDLPALAALYEKVFEDNALDALIFPTVPEVAGYANDDILAPAHFSRIIRNTDPGSNIRLTGLTLPVGLGPHSKLPVGMEIDGLPGADARLLAIGEVLETIWRHE